MLFLELPLGWSAATVFPEEQQWSGSPLYRWKDDCPLRRLWPPFSSFSSQAVGNYRTRLDELLQLLRVICHPAVDPEPSGFASELRIWVEESWAVQSRGMKNLLSHDCQFCPV